ncbi:MAG: dephospho-CoA kinase [Endomicrobium sp.]|jgi:dephospho-CoA kinase|nr:dephospho-CoA kinase [Endomicrobium sp.]
MIIGLTGSYCSGKDTVAEYISQKHGYIHFSLSDIIRELMQKDAIEPTRENLIVFGTNLREKNGNGILARKVLDKIDLHGKYCVTSIRHPDEVNELKKRKDFVLVNVDAPEDVRFKRMQKRQRPGDLQTLEKFIEFENKESQSEGSGQQIVKTARMADVTLINGSNDIYMLKVTIDELLKNIEDERNL